MVHRQSHLPWVTYHLTYDTPLRVADTDKVIVAALEVLLLLLNMELIVQLANMKLTFADSCLLHSFEQVVRHSFEQGVRHSFEQMVRHNIVVHKKLLNGHFHHHYNHNAIELMSKLSATEINHKNEIKMNIYTLIVSRNVDGYDDVGIQSRRLVQSKVKMDQVVAMVLDPTADMDPLKVDLLDTLMVVGLFEWELVLVDEQALLWVEVVKLWSLSAAMELLSLFCAAVNALMVVVLLYVPHSKQALDWDLPSLLVLSGLSVLSVLLDFFYHLLFHHHLFQCVLPVRLALLDVCLNDLLLLHWLHHFDVELVLTANEMKEKNVTKTN